MTNIKNYKSFFSLQYERIQKMSPLLRHCYQGVVVGSLAR